MTTRDVTAHAGDMTDDANGRKIMAVPKPENPRTNPAKNAPEKIHARAYGERPK